ncbi:MAG: delta-aminolevulinic acid dehydratase [Desulfobacca sp. 4484_104]|nr:MAG: delta-aminolevulinic acid dehydratase [Desulfobacca sp. 4484_104]
MELPYRPRRLRRRENFRRLVRETYLRTDDLIYPMFVVPGQGVKEEVPSMPGVCRYSVDQQQAIRQLKKQVPDLPVITDVCLCSYTSHGHCGFVRQGEVDNDATLELLAQVALSHAEAGADMVAPSDMMDGRVLAIRETLDERGFEMIPILSYAVKYASSFYGPFRDAAESAPQFGDRRSYQMDPANALEAIREATLDVEEGADIIMVKPALPYLDILARLRSEIDLPLAAYQVSGEYAMIKAASQQGWVDEQAVMLESLIAIKRAGADMILTYFAKDAAQILAK